MNQTDVCPRSEMATSRHVPMGRDHETEYMTSHDARYCVDTDVRLCRYEKTLETPVSDWPGSSFTRRVGLTYIMRPSPCPRSDTKSESLSHSHLSTPPRASLDDPKSNYY